MGRVVVLGQSGMTFGGNPFSFRDSMTGETASGIMPVAEYDCSAMRWVKIKDPIGPAPGSAKSASINADLRHLWYEWPAGSGEPMPRGACEAPEAAAPVAPRPPAIPDWQVQGIMQQSTPEVAAKIAEATGVPLPPAPPASKPISSAADVARIIDLVPETSSKLVAAPTAPRGVTTYGPTSTIEVSAPGAPRPSGELLGIPAWLWLAGGVIALYGFSRR